MEYSYLRSNVDLDIPYTTLPDLLKRRADETPDKAFCITIGDDNERYVVTFGELYHKATNFARALVQMGIKRYDKIGLSGRMFQNGFLLIWVSRWRVVARCVYHTNKKKKPC